MLGKHNKYVGDELPGRFVDEVLAEHWRVDDTEASYRRLCVHLETRTNFMSYFLKALTTLKQCHLGEIPRKIADIGAGIGWTSALLSKSFDGAKVYSIEPSKSRLQRIQATAQHFGVADDCVVPLEGYFNDLRLPEAVDLVVLCGALHHCPDADMDQLFQNIRKAYGNRRSKPKLILIANEHYVTPIWTAKRVLSYLKHFRNRHALFYGWGKWRAPYPEDNEHWRSRDELDRIFRKYAVSVKWYLHSGDLCKEKRTIYERIGWRYYFAVLDL